MAKDKEFKFYENFMRAIDTLPEEQRANACYQFCRFGIYGELPKDEALKMFCIGVSVSVQKYQNCGGNHNPTGKNQYTSGQVGQVGQVKQTKTKTKTKTQTKNINPSLDEIKQYCIERKNNVDYKRFYDYYNSANWKDSSGKSIKNWKQKMIAVWEPKVIKKEISNVEQIQEMYEYV